MMNFLKYVLYFLMYGVVWFLLFSIPVNTDENVFLVLHKTLRMTSEKEKQKTQNEIHREKVIDAITKAFK